MTTDVRLDLEIASQEPGSFAYRPIHYLGSKLRLVGEIEELVNELAAPQGTVCDLFSGSGVVTSALARSRSVVAVDIQEYARVLANAFLTPCRPSLDALEGLAQPITVSPLGESLLEAFAPLILIERLSIQRAAQGHSEELAALLEAGSVVSAQVAGIASVSPHHRKAFQSTLDALHHAELVNSPNSMVSRYFGGLYFGFEQAIALDVLLERVAVGHSENVDVVLAATLAAASDSVRTVGKQFAQPLRPRDKAGHPKAALWKTVLRSGAINPLEAFLGHARQLVSRPEPPFTGVAVRSDYGDFLDHWSESIDIFYIDPPYTRDHYSRFYHVLETMALRDNPEVSKTNLDGGVGPSRGLYRRDRHQSPFSIRRQAPAAFTQLFKLSRRFDAPLVLSYSPHGEVGASHPRVMRIEDIQRLAAEHYRTVERVDVANLAHSKLNRSDLHLQPAEIAESLLICEP